MWSKKASNNYFHNIQTLLIIVLIFSNVITAASLYGKTKLIEEQKTVKTVSGTQTDETKKELNDYLTDHLNKLLNDQELTYLAQQQWQYGLTMNGEEITQSTIYLKEDYAHIVLSEAILEKDVLPEEILNKGTITGSDANDSLENNLELYTDLDYTVKQEENSNGQRVIYDFKNIPAGTIMDVKISPMLANRLQIGEENDDWETIIEIVRN